ncbi:mannose-1-phosphate guanylyltransferase/mannose-6-phosphate isomerase [Xenophilus azovorans]|uniref:mannose-1-phosphate guanylyltransferase/mannose-6-phosphate isomerase n=1 Tax=Xenophilus azovorans TaxID=151755 RepID=UPI00056F1CBF|nr:mannose-1-phosphate guanylyltransferase/mannose-6-phosphate isomerase [Xenophilus azovorans]
MDTLVAVSSIRPVVLCGGSGTRLWPLSRKALPKQFVPLVGSKSLLQLTLERLSALSKQVICVTAEEHRFLVQESMEAAGIEGHEVLEPVARNTAAAMAAAALLADADELLLFAPADHHVPDAQAFAATIQQGADAARAGHIVTFGVVPTFPSTAYGYIQPGAELPGTESRQVARFVEKPAADRAQAMLLEGGYLWNAGIFLVRAGTLIEALRKHTPDILAASQKAVTASSTDGSFIRLDRIAFEACRSESIDYAVLEKHDKVAVIPFAGAWSDVGSWNAVASLQPADEAGNRASGRAVMLHAKNTFVHAPLRPVVALGTEDLVVVDTQDAVLVARADCVEQVKDVVALMTRDGHNEATEHRRVARPWGAYDSIDHGERFQVKRLTVKPGAKLSLQMHHHRAEHWVVVKGTAKVTRGDETLLVQENESVYIPLGTVHRLENPGKVMLEVIEVQSGGYLGEDDIVRYEDTYGRVVPVNRPQQG